MNGVLYYFIIGHKDKCAVIRKRGIESSKGFIFKTHVTTKMFLHEVAVIYHGVPQTADDDVIAV